MGLSLRMDPLNLDGDLADESDASGVETEALIALCTEARVDPSMLGKGRINRGYWADSVLQDGEQLGSSLWLLEDAASASDAAARAEQYVREALAPILASGRIVAVEAGVSITGQHIQVAPRLTLPDGSDRELGALQVN
jgi:phage gp46-like protein